MDNKGDSTKNAASEIEWTNLIVSSWNETLDKGHLPATKIIDVINTYSESPGFRLMFDLEKRSEYKKYAGAFRCALGKVIFDFDGYEESLPQAIEFTRQLGLTDVEIYFSGQKGFHIAVNQKYFSQYFGEHFVELLKQAAIYLKQNGFHHIDTTIYRKNHLIRLEKSRHNVTKLYKIRLNSEYFLQDKYTWEQILEHAKLPQYANEECAQNKTISGKTPALLIKAFEKSSRKTAPNENSDEAFSEIFSTYPEKLCIAKLLKVRTPEGERHSTAIVLVSDLFNTGIHRSDAERKMAEWISKNGFPALEVSKIISDIYEKGRRYGYGCGNEYKSRHCTSKCGIYRRLSPENRPQTIDSNPNQDPRKTEHEIATSVLNSFDGNLVRFEKTLFLYNGAFWKKFTTKEDFQLEQAIKEKYEYKVTQPKIETTKRQLLAITPEAPVNLNYANPLKVSVLNGTLSVGKLPDGSLSLTFAPFDRNDFVTNQIPIHYDISRDNEKNTKLEEFLRNAFEDSNDADEKRRAVQQMFGALLFPIYPHIFLIHGGQSTGKSTLIKLAMKLLDASNFSAVEPHEFGGFNLAAMVGKLANIVTDIDLNFPIHDANIKKIEDRVNVQVRVKFKDDLMAPLPAVHVFGANGIPKTTDGASGAHERRWTFIEFNRRIGIQDGKAVVREYENSIFDSFPQGCLNFAIEGMKDLFRSGGFFINPTSGKAAMREWQSDSDIVGRFINDLANEEISKLYGLLLAANEFAKKTTVYDRFKQWCEDQQIRTGIPERSKFLKILRMRGHDEKRTEHSRCVWGFKDLSTGPAAF